MHRCFELARLAHKHVKTNPNVGSVLVYKNRIIGEGYHQYFGGNHAERNAILSVSQSDKPFIKDARLYVTLEPCQIVSKTPACSDLILEHNIPEVIVSVEDPNPLMQGKSLLNLKRHGLKIESGILANEGQRLIMPFKKSLKKLPYIILKYAQSSDNYISRKGEQTWLSNLASKRKVHKWRSEVDAIIIGYNTALIDNPKLTTRYNSGDSPLRIVLDRMLSLPKNHHLWSDDMPTVFIHQHGEAQQTELKTTVKIDFDENLELNVCKWAYNQGLFRIIVEGGAKTLNSFISSGLWDEARIIRTRHLLGSGIRAPFISQKSIKVERFLNDEVHYFLNT